MTVQRDCRTGTSMDRHVIRAVLTGRVGGCLEVWVPFEGMTMLEAQ